MSAPAPGMFTLPSSGQRVWVSPTGRVHTVHQGHPQRTVVAKWEPDFRVTGNGAMWRALLVRWSARPEATRLDPAAGGYSGPCPTCGHHVNDLRGHVCARVKGAAA